MNTFKKSDSADSRLYLVARFHATTAYGCMNIPKFCEQGDTFAACLNALHRQVEDPNEHVYLVTVDNGVFQEVLGIFDENLRGCWLAIRVDAYAERSPHAPEGIIEGDRLDAEQLESSEPLTWTVRFDFGTEAESTKVYHIERITSSTDVTFIMTMPRRLPHFSPRHQPAHLGRRFK